MVEDGWTQGGGPKGYNVYSFTSLFHLNSFSYQPPFASHNLFFLHISELRVPCTVSLTTITSQNTTQTALKGVPQKTVIACITSTWSANTTSTYICTIVSLSENGNRVTNQLGSGFTNLSSIESDELIRSGQVANLHFSDRKARSSSAVRICSWWGSKTM